MLSVFQCNAPTIAPELLNEYSQCSPLLYMQLDNISEVDKSFLSMYLKLNQYTLLENTKSLLIIDTVSSLEDVLDFVKTDTTQIPMYVYHHGKQVFEKIVE